MFKVRRKGMNLIQTVYSVKEENGDTKFLVYFESEYTWKWVSATNYVPLNY